MNAVYLTQAEPLLRGAHAATINQGDRDALRLIHCAMLRFMRGQGILMAEIPADKASKTRAPGKFVGDMSLASSIRRATQAQSGDPLTPDPACPHCEGKGYHGAKSVFDRCICTYGNGPVAEPARRVVMDEDDAREKDMREKLFTLQSENDAWRADSQMLADICNLLTEPMQGFKGPASTPEWTVAAVRELLEQWGALRLVAQRAATRLEGGTLEEIKFNASLAKALRDQIAIANNTLRGQS